jgi:MoxR-like ATPase
MRSTERQLKCSRLIRSHAGKQVTIGDTTFKLDRPFLVLATQNPIEQEGTYQLPEAQVDRFMLKTVIDLKWMKSAWLFVKT